MSHVISIKEVTGLNVEPNFNLVCGKTIFKVHESILAASSNYILEILLNCSPGEQVNFILEDVLPEDVEQALSAIYRKCSELSSKSTGFFSVVKQLKVDFIQESRDLPLDKKSLKKSAKNSRDNTRFMKDAKTSTMHSELNKTVVTKETLCDDAVISCHDASHSAECEKLSTNSAASRNLNPSKLVTIRKSGSNLKDTKIKETRCPTPMPKLLTEHMRKSDKIQNSEQLRKRIPPKDYALKRINIIQQKIGRPLLSSTKIFPENPAIRDASNSVFKSKNEELKDKEFVYETPEHDQNQSPQDVAKSNKTYSKGQSRVTTRNFKLNDHTLEDFPGTSDRSNKASACRSCSDSPDNFSNHDSSSSFTHKTMLKVKRPRKTIIADKMRQSMKNRKLRIKTTRGTDYSSAASLGCQFSPNDIGLRKKLPTWKRRRIPASTRPDILDSRNSSLNSSFPNFQ